MINKKFIKIVGIIFIIMWISRIPYLFPHPFKEHKGVRKLATEFMQLPDWIQQKSSVKAKTADELEKTVMVEWQRIWIKSALFIVIGVLSGYLLIQYRKVGYLLTLFFSLFFIGVRFIHFLRCRRIILSLEYHRWLLTNYPVRTIHSILMLLVLLGTVILLIYVFKYQYLASDKAKTDEEQQ